MRLSCALFLLSLLVVYHTSIAAIFDPDDLNCSCRKVTSNFIHPSRFTAIKITMPGISCRRPEVIITLKTGKSVCVDPSARWVQSLLKVIKRKDSPSTAK